MHGIARHTKAERRNRPGRRNISRSVAVTGVAHFGSARDFSTLFSRSNMPMMITRVVSLNSAMKRVDDAGDHQLAGPAAE